MGTKIYFRGIEPIIVTTKVGENWRETKEIGLFDPFRGYRFKLYTMHLWLKLKSKGYKPLRCGGCGDGIVEYTITNPNYRKTDKWKVCKGCVRFYDFKWTAKPYDYKVGK